MVFIVIGVLPGHKGRIGHPDHTHFIGQTLAPWGNRTGNAAGRYPHYHWQRVKPNGKVRDGGSYRRPPVGYTRDGHILEGPVLVARKQIHDAIFVFGQPIGETEVYSSIQAVSLALEPWQLDDTFAVDGNAHRVALTSHGPKVIARETDEEMDQASLRRRVVEDLLNAGAAVDSSGDIRGLLQQLSETLGYAD